MRDLEGKNSPECFDHVKKDKTLVVPLLSAVQGPQLRDVPVNLPLDDSPQKDLTLWHKNKRSECQDSYDVVLIQSAIKSSVQGFLFLVMSLSLLN